MARKVWKPIINRKTHTIELKVNGLSGSGELRADDRLVDSWSPRWSSGGKRYFKVAGNPAMLKPTFFSYDLIINGQKVEKEHKTGSK